MSDRLKAFFIVAGVASITVIVVEVYQQLKAARTNVQVEILYTKED